MENIDTPKYIKIAIDIAQRIYNNEFKVGEKIRGRSTLSSKYNVSPETIRRAVSLLKDMQVVEVTEKVEYILNLLKMHICLYIDLMLKTMLKNLDKNKISPKGKD